MQQTARRLLHKWQTSLASKDKTWNSVSGNFDELISDWSYNGVDCDEAFNLLKEAIKTHLPSLSIAKRAYNLSARSQTFNEFVVSWNKGISDKAWEVFYIYYKVGEDKEAVKPTTQGKYGSMSLQEYVKQRTYADSFEAIDPSKIEHKPIDIAELESVLSEREPLDLEDL
jgi:hypothetical protein